MKARAFLLCLLPLLACQEGTAVPADAPAWCQALAGGPAFQVADSGGVQVASSLAPAWREPVQLPAEPRIVLGQGSAGPEDQFGRVAGATRLGDGRLVVADGQGLTVSVYDTTGSLLSRRGGRGAGPGEYMFLQGPLRAPGDTLMVIDGGTQRVTVLDPSTVEVADTRPLAAISFTRPPSTPGGRSISGRRILHLHGRFADGRYLGSHPATLNDPQPTESRVWRDSLVLWSVATPGELGDSLGIIVGAQHYLHFGEGFITGGEPPFGFGESLAVAGDRFYYGTGERFEIEERTPDGRIVRLIRLCESTDVISAADMDAEIERRLSGYDENTLRVEEPALRSLPQPEAGAAYLEFLPDDGGRLWIRDLTRPGQPQRWKVVDREGRWLGDVLTPEDVTVLEVGPDYLLGQHTDNLDVQTVRLYDVQLPTT
jgi:hypothetical protein